MGGQSCIITVIGRKGSGKTTLSRQLAKNYQRRIVFDFANEHPGRYVKSAENFIAYDRKYPFESINVRFEVDADTEEVEGITEDILHYLYKTNLNTHNLKNTVVVFEEAQFFFPQKISSNTITRILTVGRHAGLNIIANTQRPAIVSKTLLSQSDEIYTSFIWEKYDLKYLQSVVGDGVLEAKKLSNGEFIRFDGKSTPEKINVFKEIEIK